MMVEPTADESREFVSDARADLNLWRGQVWPRRWELLRSWPPYVAIGFALVGTFVAPTLPGGELSISAAAGAGLTFASIAIGACMASIVLSLGLPGATRLRRWSRYPGVSEKKSALSDLIFVLVWAGIWQLLLLIVCALAFLFGGDGPLAPLAIAPTHSVGLFIGLAVFAYAVFELLIVVSTLSQIGVVIIGEEQRGPSE